MTQTPLQSAPWRDDDPARRIGWSPAGPGTTLGEFQRRIVAWQALLDDLAAPGAHWLLHERDPLTFAAALIALWERGDSALLPADDRPETLAGVDRLTRARLGDVPGGHRPDASRDKAGEAPRWGHFDPERRALSLYTSGSTGAPQRLDKRFRQLDAELATHRTLWPLAGDVTISQVSHQHIYGLLFAILRPLCEAAPLAETTCRYLETLHAWLGALVPAERARLISAPPPLERLPESLDWAAVGDRLSAVYSSGAPLPAEAGARVRRLLGAPVREVYGSSETGGIAWRDQHDGDAWHPLPGIGVRDDGEQRLWLRSPFLETADWQRQADRIEPLADGRFRLLGRTDRIAKVGGKRVSLTAMDRALAADPRVRRASTLTLPRHATRLGAIVQLDAADLPRDHATRRALVASLRRQLTAAFETTVIPRYWRFVAAWPTNAQGKLSAERIERLFRDLHDRRQPRWLGVETPAPDECRIALEVPERLAYLDGHFPDHPVVPGVVLVQWACDLAREHLGLSAPFTGMERVKFPLLLLPGERVTLSLALAAHDDHQRLMFAFDGARGCHASGRARFALEEVP
ncbi:AMP-binding protein [Modicisalibacter coralii]|uniref:AMP-binding protein n=1 Tax=Modicisalibacter coralii TaxID=2304602 RepID=UPI00100B72E5|nr:AMP-binding protein [Halomonas coralii]